MSRTKTAPKSPWRIDASANGIVDFVEGVTLHTPMENVVGGPPAYLESHGIRYVPEGAPGAAPPEAAGQASPPGLSAVASEPAQYYSRQELEARVDRSVNQFMRETVRAPGFGAHTALERRAGETPGESTDARLRDLMQRMDSAAPLPASGLASTRQLRSAARASAKPPLTARVAPREQGYDY